MKQKSIYILLMSILLTACTSKVLIDNPTPKKLDLTIGTKKLSLEAKTTKTINIKNGTQLVLSINSDGDTLVNEQVNITETGLLNVTNTDYYLWTDLFCEEKDFNTYKSHLNLKDTVKINTFEFVDIDLVVLNDKFISTQWDFAIDDNIPKEMEVSDEIGFKVVSKIYRLHDLIEVFNYIGDLDLSDLTQEEIEAVIKNRNTQN